MQPYVAGRYCVGVPNPVANPYSLFGTRSATYCVSRCSEIHPAYEQFSNPDLFNSSRRNPPKSNMSSDFNNIPRGRDATAL